MVMSHNLHNNLGNWCIFPENLLIYQGKLVEAANSLRRRNNNIFLRTCGFRDLGSRFQDPRDVRKYAEKLTHSLI